MEKTVELLDGAVSWPTSVDIADDGAIFVTMERENATLLKLDANGALLWKFEIPWVKGIDQQFMSAVPLSDGGAVVCSKRFASPGSDASKSFPGAIYRVDGSGKEVKRFDEMERPSTDRTFSGGIMCARWQDDIVFVATTFPLGASHRYQLQGQSLVENLVMRVSVDLEPIWRHFAPIYDTVTIIGTRPTAQPLSGGNLLLGEAGLSIILDGNGSVKDARASEYSVVVKEGGPVPREAYVLSAESDSSRWRSHKVNTSIEGQETLLDELTRHYKMSSAVVTERGELAAVGIKNDQADVLVFDSAGKHLGTTRLPGRSLLSSDEYALTDMSPSKGGVVVLMQKLDSKKSSSILVWVSIH